MNDRMKTFFRKLRILPVLIVVASLAFVVRLGDAYVSMKSLSGSAYAEEVKKAEEEPTEKAPEPTADTTKTEPSPDALKSAEEAAKESAATPDKKEDSPSDISLPSTEPDKAAEETTGDKKEAAPAEDAKEEATGPEKRWQDASDTDIENSDIKKEMYQDLTKRRLEIDEKDKKLGEREALLEAAQKELDRKVKEMEGLRDELRDLLKQQTADEATRIQSLVKIYSGMKPKDAARIFDTLDTDILMDVISNMPESKASPIMALMTADRAKALTTLLAEQKKLPEVP